MIMARTKKSIDIHDITPSFFELEMKIKPRSIKFSREKAIKLLREEFPDYNPTKEEIEEIRSINDFEKMYRKLSRKRLFKKIKKWCFVED